MIERATPGAIVRCIPAAAFTKRLKSKHNIFAVLARHRSLRMMKLNIAAFGLALAVAALAAQAQVTLDVSKVTCDQWVEDKAINQPYTAAWLSGYYNGTKGNPVLDAKRLEDDAKKIGDFCLIYKQASIMDAASAVFGAKPVFETNR
jgi:hypothetical protein